jgi:peptidoglycan/xylan/chitin deacetylase (PgdA/CDA1 family)
MSREGPASLRSLGMRGALIGRAALERADQWVARIAPRDRPGLLVFVFHCVFNDAAEADAGVVDPHERATPEGLARLCAYFRDHGYRFVSAREIDSGLPAGGLYAHLTFDDGFANNLRLLDLLAREQVHATIFPSANHVRDGKAFWWNVVYRERNRRGEGGSVAAECGALRARTVEEVERHLTAEFGPNALQPVGDVDRPLSVEELREIASSQWIEIGNHTLDHAVLDLYPPSEAEEQVAGAQRWLGEVLGREPFVIAYPNGNADDALAGLARRSGLRIGVTVVPELNRLPYSDDRRMRLGRFRVVFDHRERQRMRAVRSSVQLAAAARGFVFRG